MFGNKAMFGNIYKGKRVIVTGHTGFKGTWLTCWLLKLGAEVCGLSKDIPTTPSMFDDLKLASKLQHHVCDIRDLERTKAIIEAFKPDFLFHLAAQPIVSESFSDPITTLNTNIIGTAHILECLRTLQEPCAAILITSDKCYENLEWEWGYRETDHMGGKDIYSASKAAAELVISAYQRSFLASLESNVRLGIGRAGNVIGGGDWAKDRIVVDCMKMWAEKKPVVLRAPNSTRPWQHVLEPLSGYLMLGWKLKLSEVLNGEAFNFGPRSEQNRTVLELLQDLSVFWDIGDDQPMYEIANNATFGEASLLKLNCDKALSHLKWSATLSYAQCVKLVGEWYREFFAGDVDMFDLTMAQLSQYEAFAEDQAQEWVA